MSFLSLLRLDSLLGGTLVVVHMLLNAQAGKLLGEGLAVLGVGHGVDDGVQAAGGLGDEGGNLREGIEIPWLNFPSDVQDTYVQ